MEGEGASLTWQERVKIAMWRQHTSQRDVVAAAKNLGLRINTGTVSEAMSGKMPPNDRVVAAFSIVLDIHPDDLGFKRTKDTELGYLAYEAVKRGAPTGGKLEPGRAA
jgi:hypothetical protein